ncbi:MAG: rhomboid family intramembrane serine protease [Flavobacteriaceae bacterium]|nr:rhomboid family intramembrane serine protease [Flavobacteriaceae bacterium]
MPILDDLKFQYKTGGIAQKLIFLNVALYIISLPLFYNFSYKTFFYPSWLALSSSVTVFGTNPWTVFTYMFLHAGFLHLLFNMMVLHFAGRLFATFFTDRQMLGLYILTGIFSGLVYVGVYSALGISTKLVGASGAIMGVLIATAVYAPYMELRLALIGRVKLWQVALVLLLFDLVQLPIENSGGHLAHLAGALFGFIYIKTLQRGFDLSKPISILQDFFEDLQKPKKKKPPFKAVHKNSNINTTNTNFNKDINQKKIDDILDKISQSGYDSLTKEEKEFLFKAGK